MRGTIARQKNTEFFSLSVYFCNGPNASSCLNLCRSPLKTFEGLRPMQSPSSATPDDTQPYFPVVHPALALHSRTESSSSEQRMD